jgi:ArsR family transcriptional regulator
MRSLSKIFKALSDTNRLRILKMLELRPLCVCEVREVLGLANSTVSKHLSVLRDADLIADEKQGKWVNYSLNMNSANKYTEVLLPVLKDWIVNNEIIQKDRRILKKVDREKICGI